MLVTITKAAAPEGQVNYACPAKFPVAQSGSETFDAAGQKDVILVISDGLEVKSGKTQTNTWSFYLRWPNGIKAKEVVTVDVYCEARAPS